MDVEQQSNPEKISNEEFNSLYYDIIGDYIDINPQAYLEIELANENFHILLDRLSKFIVPICARIILCDVKCINEKYVNNFLSNAIQPNQNGLVFNDCVNFHLIDLSIYLSPLCKAVSNLTKYFDICNAKVTNSQLNQLILSASNCETFGIWNCQILSDAELNFMDVKTSRISIINISYFKDAESSDLKTTNVEELLIAISKLDSLRDSIKQISIQNCDATESEIKGIMKELQLTKIKLIIPGAKEGYKCTIF